MDFCVKGNTLDLLITNIPESVEEFYEMGRLGKSDHVMIMASVTIKADQKEDRQHGPRLEKGQLGGHAGRPGQPEVETASRTLKQKLHGLIGLHVPTRRRQNRARPPWLSQEILRRKEKSKNGHRHR